MLIQTRIIKAMSCYTTLQPDEVRGDIMQRIGTVLSSSHAKGIAPACVHNDEAFPQRGIARIAVSSLLCAALIGCCQPNDSSCRNVSIGPSGAEVAGIAIGVGVAVATVVAVEVHHSRHTLSGCVSNGPGGMQIQAGSGTKTYRLSGNTANIPAGERVRLHGTRVKQQKHSTADPTFSVERENKDYGPCKLNVSSATAP